ncbi:MAG: hypothetical protein Q7R95_07910 [bacterium]|nr:hypothetical protein [bacterium]
MIYDQKQKLLNNSRDPIKLQAIRAKLCLPNGGIFQGRIPGIKWSKENIGQTYYKTIMASRGIENLKLGTYTVLGGWCALRTKCINDLSKGILTDLSTGQLMKFKSVKEVTNWITNAVSADQITESIGIYNGTSYASISEEYLWTQKAAQILKKYLNRNLTSQEQENIRRSIHISDDKRYKITKKYIEFVLNKKIDFTKIVDIDILPDLIDSRDRFLDSIHTSLKDLATIIIKEILDHKKINGEYNKEFKIIYKRLFDYLNNYSVILFMYTGYYLDILKRKGYVKSPKAIIMEPYSHVLSNEFEAEFKRIIFSTNNGKNNYLIKNGANEDLGIIVIDDVCNYSHRRVKKYQSIHEIPNIQNYHNFIDRLSSDKNMSALDLKNNPVFMCGVNYLPYGRCNKALLEMIDIRNEYLVKKKQVKQYKDDESFFEITELKKIKSSLISKQAKIVLEELEKLFTTIFTI